MYGTRRVPSRLSKKTRLIPLQIISPLGTDSYCTGMSCKQFNRVMLVASYIGRDACLGRQFAEWAGLSLKVHLL